MKKRVQSPVPQARRTEQVLRSDVSATVPMWAPCSPDVAEPRVPHEASLVSVPDGKAAGMEQVRSPAPESWTHSAWSPSAREWPRVCVGAPAGRGIRAQVFVVRCDHVSTPSGLSAPSRGGMKSSAVFLPPGNISSMAVL